MKENKAFTIWTFLKIFSGIFIVFLLLFFIIYQNGGYSGRTESSKSNIGINLDFGGDSDYSRAGDNNITCSVADVASGEHYSYNEGYPFIEYSEFGCGVYSNDVAKVANRVILIALALISSLITYVIVTIVRRKIRSKNNTKV